MNKRQKEVQQSLLNNEREFIKRLKAIYEKASKDCEDKIRQLSARTDMENLQSIIYQRRYQEILKKQIDEALLNIQSNEYTSVNEYLEHCYTNGFTGTLYDLHGQSVPLLFPIDQRQVAQTVQIDSKISNSLYTRMGEDVEKLKRDISSEVSRGIANGSTWNQTAVNIAFGMNSPFKRAYNSAIRITRTEGHRIQNQAQMDTIKTAKSKGADIVKQWDSTLDGSTRDSHRRLDGQIKEIDEPFEIGGLSAMYPGDFGDPAEDCNCRCCMLQRAKWVLDESELKELKDRAAYFGLDKTEDFEDFKRKYLNAVENSGDGDIINIRGQISAVEVRKWYIEQDKNIPNLIDRTKTLKEQAQQACRLRNQYKYQARELMKDQELRNKLDKERPIENFEYYYDKYSKIYGNDDDVYKAIIDSSTRPNKQVNKFLGLEE